MSEPEQTAIESQPPSIHIIFEGSHRTGAYVAYSDEGIDVGQLIIAREMLNREIDNQYKQLALGVDTRKRGLYIPKKN